MSTAVANYCEHLQRSFAALYAALEIPRIARRMVAVLLIIHTGLLAYSAYVHSPTLNEPGHLVAGLSYWKFGRFDVYNVNPPLVKMVAALPVMAVGYQEDWSGFYEGPGARPEMGMGENFVAANGERSFDLFMIARWACIPFSWIGAIVCYLWARDLYGRPSGLIAAAIWCFEPNILAHAALITSDAAGTALGLAACYTFWRWLKQPTWRQAALTGVVLGLAELAKTTLILFYPLWPLMWLIYRWSEQRIVAISLREIKPKAVTPSAIEDVAIPLAERDIYTWRDWLREAGMLALRMLIGLYVLNLGYGFEGSLTQLKEYHFVSDLLTGKEPEVGSKELANPNSITSAQQLAPSASSTNRFANSWLGQLPVPFPKHYLLGIDIQQKDFEHYGRPSYLRGEWRDQGWWYYYLYACAIKVPLGLWALGVFAFVVWLIGHYSENGRDEGFPTPDTRRPTPALRDELILLFPAIVIFAVVSSKTGFSEHMRYVLPAFPYVFIAVSQVARVFGNYLEKMSSNCLTSRSSMGYNQPPMGQNLASSFPGGRMSLASSAVVASLFSWLLASSVWIYPHSLSYFNELTCGPLHGARYLSSSNIDWGQDLRYAKQWTGMQEPKDSLFIVSNTLVSPELLGIQSGDQLQLEASPNHILAQDVLAPQSPHRQGKIVISVLCLDPPMPDKDFSEAFGPVVTGKLRDYLNSTVPVSRIGYSMRAFAFQALRSCDRLSLNVERSYVCY